MLNKNQKIKKKKKIRQTFCFPWLASTFTTHTHIHKQTARFSKSNPSNIYSYISRRKATRLKTTKSGINNEKEFSNPKFFFFCCVCVCVNRMPYQMKNFNQKCLRKNQHDEKNRKRKRSIHKTDYGTYRKK